MHFERSHIGFFLAFILIGAILGSALGSLFVSIFPGAKIIQKTLTGPIGFNLEIISFNLKLNLSSIIGIIIGIFLFRKV